MRNKLSLSPLLLCFILLAGLFSGCGGAAEREKEKLSVVATVFPLWDWTRELLGGADEIELTLLLDNGTDMHSCQPTVDDLVTISSADLLIYVGGESDEWLEDALSEKVNPDLIAVNLMEVLGDRLKLEERVEGMKNGAEEDEEYDEHIWFSLKNAEICCTAIADALIHLSPGLTASVTENKAAYLAQLEVLDTFYKAAADGAAQHVLLFADRFPFRYLLDEYGLSYYAAFAGCEAETGASFETVAFLAGKVDELGLSAVLTTDSPVPRLAETIAANTRHSDAAILELDSMQSVTSADIEGGASYLGIMESNLEILKEALR